MQSTMQMVTYLVQMTRPTTMTMRSSKKGQTSVGVALTCGHPVGLTRGQTSVGVASSGHPVGLTQPTPQGLDGPAYLPRDWAHTRKCGIPNRGTRPGSCPATASSAYRRAFWFLGSHA